MKKIIIAATALVAMVSMSACDPWGKATEQYKDADRSGTMNTSPADTITFPDGFSNAATKCDHGNRVYVLFHNDKPYGDIAVVPNDPTCKGLR